MPPSLSVRQKRSLAVNHSPFLKPSCSLRNVVATPEDRDHAMNREDFRKHVADVVEQAVLLGGAEVQTGKKLPRNFILQLGVGNTTSVAEQDVISHLVDRVF